MSPNEHDKHLTDDQLIGEPSVESAPPQAIHWCLDQIWQRFHLRARLFLLEGDDLVLRDCVGIYRCCPEIGLRAHSESVVWKIFQQGSPVNLTESFNHKRGLNTLQEPVAVKAVIPLRGIDIPDASGRTMGVLVVDAGDPPRPIENRDFQYLEVLAMLISEILQRSILMERIEAIQGEKDRMAREVSHIFRTSYTVIGGFARKMAKTLLDPTSKKCAEIILQEAIKGERTLKAWSKLHEKTGMGRGKP